MQFKVGQISERDGRALNRVETERDLKALADLGLIFWS